MNLNNNETEIPEDQLEEHALKLNAKDLACRSKAKAKPERREIVGFSPGEYSLSDDELSKKVIHLLRLGKHVHREDDGANEFWRIKNNLQEHFLVLSSLV